MHRMSSFNTPCGNKGSNLYNKQWRLRFGEPLGNSSIYSAPKIDAIMAKLIRENSDQSDTPGQVLSRIADGDFVIPTDIRMNNPEMDEEELQNKLAKKAARTISMFRRNRKAKDDNR